MKDVAAATRIWKSVSPALRGLDADGYVAEPYVTPGNVDGPLSDTPGRAGMALLGAALCANGK